MGKEAKTKTITDLKKIKVLADPIRQKILSAFVKEPRTTKQAADFLGMKATNLYHHVALLEEHGFLELVSTNQKRGTTEKYFQATATRFEVGAEGLQGDPDLSVIDQMLRLSIEATLNDLRKLGPDEQGNALSMTGLMYLTEEELTDLRNRILDMVQVSASRERANRKPFRILTVLAPTTVEETDQK